MKKKIVFFCPLLFILMLGLCQSRAQTPTPDPTDVRYQSDSDFEKQFVHLIHVFERPIVIYHYGTRGPGQYLDGVCPPEGCAAVIDLKTGNGLNGYLYPAKLNEPESEKYFKAMTGQFAYFGGEWNMVRGGLYAAVDPLQSIGYGNDPWFALQINIPKGMKYLDLRKIDTTTILGTESSHSELDIHHRQRIVALLKKYHVAMFAYSWKLSAMPVCTALQNLTDDNGSIAFNLVNPEIFPEIKIQTFVSTIEKNPTIDKKIAYELYLKKILVGSYAQTDASTASASPPDLDNNSFPKLQYWVHLLKISLPGPQEITDLLKQIQTETFMCDPHHPEETLGI